MYIYCLVIPEGGHTGYYYISEMEDIKQGDTVVIPFGSSDREICGEISSIGYYTAENAPYPPARTKRILRKADAVTEYEFLTVLPITHKKKTFGYINTIPEVRIGDYVDVEFRDEIRIARVLDKTTGTITASPENFMGNMKVLRLLDYDNSDFIRFLSDLKPLSEIKGSLYRPEDENDLIPDVADAEFLPGVYRLLKSPRTLSLRSRIRLLTQVNVYFQEKETRNRFCPRLTETAVETFERVYRIRLPEEYKYFITQIADGALGIRGLNVEAFEPEYIYLRWPFVFRDLPPDPINLDLMETLDFECEWDSCATCPKRDVCPDSESFDKYGWVDRRSMAGTLTLLYDGGDTQDRMVISGPYAGAVIEIDDYLGRTNLVSLRFSDYLREYVDKRFLAAAQKIKKELGQ